MITTHTVVIGAGQAGLAVSRCLHDLGIEHTVLERGRVGERWAERWDSIRLLSPNWMTRLPGWHYRGPSPDGFMTRDEVQTFLGAYARSFQSPVEEETTVQRVRPVVGGWSIETDKGNWRAQNVVIATGHSQETNVPSMATALPRHIRQLGTSEYRNPDQIPDGVVLVVGASASGVQLADELARAGREVILSVGRHTRLPRRYRGRDIMFWLERIGALRKPLSDMPDPAQAQREPSLQLTGNDLGQSIDLVTLKRCGVRVVGRLTDIDAGHLTFGSDLAQHSADADRRMAHLLAKIDQHIASHGLDAVLPAPEPWTLTPFAPAPTSLSLSQSGVRSVVWANGYRRAYPWLHADVLDEHGEVRNHRGRTPAPGLFIIGLQFMIRRNSSFIDGVGDDAREIANAIASRVSHDDKEAA